MARRMTIRGNIDIIIVLLISVFHSAVDSQSSGNGCNVTSILVPDSNTQGASESADGKDVASCRNVCAQQSNCYGFDWNRIENKCFLVQTPDAYIYYNNSPGVDHYILMKNTNNCIGSCSYPNWVPSVNNHSFQAKGLTVNSLSECVQLCLRNASCLAFDWDQKNSINCWLQSDPDFSTAEANGLYLYVKICSSIAGTTTVSTSTPSTLSSTTLRVSSTTLPSALGTQLSSIVSQDTILSTIFTGSSSLQSSSSTSTSSLSSSTPANNSLISVNPTSISTSSSVALSVSTGVTDTNTSIQNTSTAATSQSRAIIPEPSESYGIASMVISPTYVILAGLGGGCILLVITAVVILCEYPLNGTSVYSESSDDNTSEPWDFRMFENGDVTEPTFPGVAATEFEAGSILNR